MSSCWARRLAEAAVAELRPAASARPSLAIHLRGAPFLHVAAFYAVALPAASAAMASASPEEAPSATASVTVSADPSSSPTFRAFPSSTFRAFPFPASSGYAFPFPASSGYAFPFPAASSAYASPFPVRFRSLAIGSGVPRLPAIRSYSSGSGWAWTPWEPTRPKEAPLSPQVSDDIIKQLSVIKLSNEEEMKLKNAFLKRFYSEDNQDPKTIQMNFDIIRQKIDEVHKDIREANTKKREWGSFMFFGKKIDLSKVVAFLGLFFKL